MSFSSSLPWMVSASTAPWFSIGQSAKDMLADCHISCTAIASVQGSPWPPCSGSNGTLFQPPS